jgi:hypothetical protein
MKLTKAANLICLLTVTPMMQFFLLHGADGAVDCGDAPACDSNTNTFVCDSPANADGCQNVLFRGVEGTNNLCKSSDAATEGVCNGLDITFSPETTAPQGITCEGN